MPVVDRRVVFVVGPGGGDLSIPLRRGCSAFLLFVLEDCGFRDHFFLHDSSGFGASEFSFSVSVSLSMYMFVG